MRTEPIGYNMSSLDCEKLLAETWIAQMESHATITSTNDRAAEAAKEGAKALPLLVIADEQTAGRGRGGNRWWTGNGSLAFSVLFDAVAEKENQHTTTPLIGLTAALAVVEVIRPLVGDRDLGVHWPNDVFAAGRKLAGILVEVLADRKTIVGIGLNVNNSVASAPEELQKLATTLFDLTQIQHDRTDVLISLLGHWKRFLDMAASSPAKIAAAADAVCLQKGKLLHLQWGTAVHSGVCRGIDGTGAILLGTEEGLKAFPSGVLLKDAVSFHKLATNVVGTLRVPSAE